MADTMGRYLRAGEVAELLGLSKKHVYLMSKQRKLPSVKFCGNLRFPIHDLVQYLECHRRFPGNNEDDDD
jgi:excisionase family DNA binding protein